MFLYSISFKNYLITLSLITVQFICFCIQILFFYKKKIQNKIFVYIFWKKNLNFLYHFRCVKYGVPKEKTKKQINNAEDLRHMFKTGNRARTLEA